MELKPARRISRFMEVPRCYKRLLGFVCCVATSLHWGCNRATSPPPLVTQADVDAKIVSDLKTKGIELFDSDPVTVFIDSSQSGVFPVDFEPLLAISRRLHLFLRGKGPFRPYLSVLIGTRVIHVQLPLGGVCDDDLRCVTSFPQLELLSIPEAMLSDAACDAIANASTLTTLGIFGSQVSARGVAHLKRLPNLESLTVGWHALDDDCWREISELPRLTCLVASHWSPEALQLERLANRNRLQSLSLVDCTLGVAETKQLGRMTALTWLGLSSSTIGNAEMGQLSTLTNLEELDLSSTPIGDDGIASLVQFVKLKRLNLAETSVTDEALIHLKSFAGLEWLNLHKTRVSAEGLSELRRTLINCEVEINQPF